jgi:hypothetical protein
MFGQTSSRSRSKNDTDFIDRSARVDGLLDYRCKSIKVGVAQLKIAESLGAGSRAA